MHCVKIALRNDILPLLRKLCQEDAMDLCLFYLNVMLRCADLRGNCAEMCRIA